MRLGSLQLRNNLIAAPLCGISNRAYRVLCKRYGAGLTYVEMLKVESYLHHNRKTMTLKYYREDERPIGIQFAGNNPAWLAEACKQAEDEGYDIIDFNMGCPVPKIGKCGAGSALMAYPDRAAKCFKAMVDAVKIPVSVKFRAGVNDGNLNFIQIGKLAEENGIVACTIHPRTRQQSFTGQADHSRTAELKAALKIPVIASGDINEPDFGVKLLKTTGCDGLMLGRGAWGRPWLFREITETINHGRVVTPSPTAIERLAVLREHYELLLECFSERHACQVVRKYATWYIRDIKGSAALRGRFSRVNSRVEFHEALDEAMELYEREMSRDNQSQSDPALATVG